jgi:pimeloyl-ACP methyl ester carboxylesterase
MYGAYAAGANDDNTQVALIEGYTAGDNVLYLWEATTGRARLLNGRPLDEREPGEDVPLTSFGATCFVPSGRGLLITTSLFEDTYGLGYIALAEPETVARVEVRGAVHQGLGEMENLKHLRDNRYAVQYNIDGESWLYEGEFDEDACAMRLDAVICGRGQLSGGVMDSFDYDKAADRYALSFSTATSPTQIYTIEGAGRNIVRQHTSERVLGLPQAWLSPGEDASFTSHDGLRVSARLYRPSPELGYEGPRPLVYYVHGGPQGQERPDFSWFSMPLIQFLTLNGFAVFVPNARGSTGYGLSYMKHVDRDWGGQDRLDHVHAMKLLAGDEGIDAGRAAVIGRSYGGYMTLTLAARHPELWSAAVDMFGPYDLLTFMERLPETWKPYFVIAIGDPVKDRDFLIERSPQSHIAGIQCPLLVIQGQNDPRVIERESRDVVEQLRAADKEVDYLVFADEGHDVLKYENRVTCYNAITDFFRKHLM